MLYKRLYDVIGNTPMLEIEKNFYLKLECQNPTGSIKDRAAYKMIIDAEEKGILKKGSIIIEPTSGNMGISLSLLGLIKGYKVIICMPNNMSIERVNMLRLLNANVILTNSKWGIGGSVKLVRKLCERIPNLVMLDQFNNEANCLAHYDTGKEILNDVPDIDYLVAGIGTGGTISGIGKYLYDKCSCNVIGVLPIEKYHNIQGIGAGFKPNILKEEYIDKIMTISSKEAYMGMKELIVKYGILGGISSGASYKIGYELHRNNPDKKIVVIIPDGTNRYLSISG